MHHKFILVSQRALERQLLKTVVDMMGSFHFNVYKQPSNPADHPIASLASAHAEPTAASTVDEGVTAAASEMAGIDDDVAKKPALQSTTEDAEHIRASMTLQVSVEHVMASP